MTFMFSPNDVQLAAPIFIGFLLFVLSWIFLAKYYFPALKLHKELRKKIEATVKIKSIPAGSKRKELKNIFVNSLFGHAWQEYDETLHDQTEFNDGELRILNTRSTVQSGYFFTPQNIVDTKLKTEFFKHLPGIITGIGIIGTFVGLLVGLNYFDPSDPTKVQQSVTLLLGGVRDAFYASAGAITVAMIVTAFEKIMLRVCYEDLEKLTESIDSLFVAAVGEDYLADLVKSSHENSIQTRQLKDSLVTDLREMLQNLVDTQVRESMNLAQTLSSSYQDAGKNMADQISSSIKDSFQDPLNKIAESVKTAQGDQSGRVQNMLEEVMVGLMNRLEDTFGQQFNGLHEMMGQSVAAMSQMQQGFATLISEMRSAGEESGKALHAELAKTLAEMHSGQALMQASMNEMIENLQKAVAGIGEQGEAAGGKMAAQLQRIFSENEVRQQSMADEFQTFINSIKESVGESQSATMRQLADTVDELGGRLSSMLNTFEESRLSMDKSSSEAQSVLHEGTQALITSLGDQVKHLLSSMESEREATHETIKLIGEQTERSLTGMQLGADKMRLAADRFEEAGTSLGQVTQSNGELLQRVQASAASMTAATSALGHVVADYGQSRDALLKTIQEIESIVATAQAEAGVRTQVIQDMRSVGVQLQALNKEAVVYLEQVGSVLSKSFDEFGSGVERSLTKSLGSLDQEMDRAVKALAGGVEELNENIGELSEAVEKAIAVGAR